MDLVSPDGLMQLCLSARPTIRQAGLGTHGRKRIERFTKPGLWGLHLYFWEGSLSFAGRSFQIEPHRLSVTPPDIEVSWHFPATTCPHYFVHFELTGSRDATFVPVIQPLGERFSQVNSRIERIVSIWQEQRTRAAVSLWDLLWELAGPSPTSEPSATDFLPAEIETAVGIIENEIGGDLNAKTLAHRIGISYSQLNRLFQLHLDASVGQYLTQKRLALLKRLLVASNLPIKVIAQMVGFRDLQHFNKFVRKHLETSPRKYREAKGFVPGD
jgi:AraC-like DNA-binding protein